MDGLAGQFVGRSRKYAFDAIQIITCRKAVVGYQRGSSHDASHRMPRSKTLRAHIRTNLPLTAASTHASIEANIGR